VRVDVEDAVDRHHAGDALAELAGCLERDRARPRVSDEREAIDTSGVDDRANVADEALDAPGLPPGARATMAREIEANDAVIACEGRRSDVPVVQVAPQAVGPRGS